MSADNQVRVTVGVAVPPPLAFEVFTQEIDLWWRRGPQYRQTSGPRALMAIEPRAGGRVFEQGDPDAPVQEVGRVLAWEPPHRLVFTWRAANFAPLEHTEVDVRFEPSAQGTTVTVTHRGWAALRADHPVRHGQASAAFLRRLGLWWGGLLAAYRFSATIIADRRNPGP